jgi:hypothetical protein
VEEVVEVEEDLDLLVIMVLLVVQELLSFVISFNRYE